MDKLLGKLILPITKRIRAYHVLKFIQAKPVHLDIGCGEDKYLLSKSPCENKIGFDEKIGTKIEDFICLESESADYITMLAVIEHLEYPREVIKDCARVLKNDGLLIITTPKKNSEFLIKFYFKNIVEDHKSYFSLCSMKHLLEGYFEIIRYQKFELRFNQLFVCKKIVYNKLDVFSRAGSTQF